MTRRSANSGMVTFTLIWLGQLLSLVGSGLTEFALGVWVYQRSGIATEFVLIVFFVTLPHVLISPFAGAIVDRYDRRWVMILADSGAALSSLTAAGLAWTGALEVWHVYIIVLVTSACGSFQFPAYATVVTSLVPKQQLGRANGMVEMAWAVSSIASPLLAGILMGFISLHGVILVDVITFAIGVGVLLVVRIARPEATADRSAPKGSLLREARYGLTYISARPGLRGLLAFFVVVNFSVGLFNGLFPPMILSFGTPEVLGSIYSVGGVGLLIGGLVLTAWGGPKRRILGILGSGPVMGLGMLMMGAQVNPYVIGAAGFLYMFVHPFINGSDHAIWQSKVALDVQGRVFGTRHAIENSSTLLAYLVGGPLADWLFNPLLVEGGPLASSVGQVIGVGPGRGIGLIFVLAGLAIVGMSVWSYLAPRVRLIEDELPDAIVEKSEEPADSKTLVPAA